MVITLAAYPAPPPPPLPSSHRKLILPYHLAKDSDHTKLFSPLISLCISYLNSNSVSKHTHTPSLTLSASGEDMDQSMEKPLLGRDVQATKKHWIRTLLCLLALIAIITFIVLLIVHHEKTDSSIVQSKKEKTDSSIVQSEKAVVATDDERCSKIGVLMLRKDGHAVDAAVAAALCLSVVNPSESGIGGGAFMMVRSSESSQTQAYDMRETAPLASSKLKPSSPVAMKQEKFAAK